MTRKAIYEEVLNQARWAKKNSPELHKDWCVSLRQTSKELSKLQKQAEHTALNQEQQQTMLELVEYLKLGNLK
jgi:hypothetical protein